MPAKRSVSILAVLLLAFVFSRCDCDSPESPRRDPFPTKPYSPYPAHLSTEQSRTPIFSWECDPPSSGDALTYELELWKTGFPDDAVTIPAPEDSLAYEDTLDAETEYSWRVDVETEAGYTAEGDVWRFATGSGFNNPPAPPRLLRPLSLAPSYEIDWPIDVTFEWTCFDPDGDDLVYDVLLAPHGDALVPVSEGQSAMDYQHPSLEADSLYDWQVVARDDGGGSDSSEVATFRTGTANHCPTKPIPVYPPDSAIDVPLDVTLRWHSTDADGDEIFYTLWFDGEVLVENTPDTMYLVEGLEYGTLYRWRISRLHDGECYISGDYWEFTTIVDPAGYPGIYAELIVSRSQYLSGEDLTEIDHVSARFDSVFAPDGYIHPLEPAGVTYDLGVPPAVPLPWDDYFKQYYLDDPVNGSFLAPDERYYFHVAAGDGVPALEASIYYFDCRPYITSPEAYSWVTLEGLELVWADFGGSTPCSRPVTIRLFDLSMLEWTGVEIVTENDGSYSFTAADVAGIDPMVYQVQIVLIFSNRESIVEAGFDARSFIEARTWATQVVFRNP